MGVVRNTDAAPASTDRRADAPPRPRARGCRRPCHARAARRRARRGDRRADAPRFRLRARGLRGRRAQRRPARRRRLRARRPARPAGGRRRHRCAYAPRRPVVGAVGAAERASDARARRPRASACQRPALDGSLRRASAARLAPPAPSAAHRGRERQPGRARAGRRARRRGRRRGAARRAAADRPARAVGRRRRHPARTSGVRDRRGRVRPSHREPEHLRPRRFGRDRPRDSQVPPGHQGLERHRLQLRRRPLRPDLRGACGRHRPARDRGPHAGLQRALDGHLDHRLVHGRAGARRGARRRRPADRLEAAVARRAGHRNARPDLRRRRREPLPLRHAGLAPAHQRPPRRRLARPAPATSSTPSCRTFARAPRRSPGRRS